MGRFSVSLIAVAVAGVALAPGLAEGGRESAAQAGSASAAAAPTPLADGGAQDWVFVFKLNAKIFPSGGAGVARDCPFGGSPIAYGSGGFSQAYAYATNSNPRLRAGAGLIGTSLADPLGATFSQIWNGNYNYVVWNDQFYDHPAIAGCSQSCGGPWGHSKGMLAWNDAGEGMILQVTTPSWPAAGSKRSPRTGDGNTLGCVTDNDVKVSQDFFAVRLSESDVEHVLDALANASVVTNPADPSIVRTGGPAAIRAKVAQLGHKSASKTVLDFTLSSGVRLLSKPSALHVPPWQLVSAELGGVSLRTATWWTSPAIPTTTASTAIICWDPSLAALHKPGAVEIATSGKWSQKVIGLRGTPPDGNHGKIGVSLTGAHPYTVFGDMNQQGTLGGGGKQCASSQNGRGGLFFVVENAQLHDGVSALVAGDTAPAAP